MTASFKYDSVISRQLALNTSPDLVLDYQREAMRFATASGLLTFDNSYPTGGYAASPAKFGLTSINGALFGHPPGYVCVYNATTDKVQVFQQSAATGALTEVPNATNLSAVAAVYYEAKGLE